MKKFQKATVTLAAALTLSSPLTMAQPAKANIFEWLREPAEAVIIDIIKDIFEPKPRSKSKPKPVDKSSIFKELLEQCNTISDHRKGLQACDRAIEINSESAEVWTGRGSRLARLDREKKALKSYQRAIQLSPKNSLAWSNLCSTQVNLGQYSDALESCNRALRYDQGWADRATPINRSAYGSGQWKDGDTSWSEAAAWHGKGVALYKLRRCEEARSALNQAVKLNPTNSVIRSHRDRVICTSKHPTPKPPPAPTPEPKAHNLSGEWTLRMGWFDYNASLGSEGTCRRRSDLSNVSFPLELEQYGKDLSIALTPRLGYEVQSDESIVFSNTARGRDGIFLPMAQEGGFVSGDRFRAGTRQTVFWEGTIKGNTIRGTAYCGKVSQQFEMIRY